MQKMICAFTLLTKDLKIRLINPVLYFMDNKASIALKNENYNHEYKSPVVSPQVITRQKCIESNPYVQ